MNRSGALKLKTILIVLVLCISSIGIGLLLTNKGSSSIISVDASTIPTGYPLNTGENSSIPGSNSGNSNDSWMLNNDYFNGITPQVFLSGNYGYRALYDGDCNGESRVTSYTSTVLGVTSINYGQAVRDNATVTGQGSNNVPTGTVDFQVKIGSGPWNTYSHDVSLIQGSAVSGWYTPMAPGNYDFRAVYSGDTVFYCSQSGNCEESLQVGKAYTTTTTNLGASEITMGSSVTDNVTVTGLGGIFSVPTGTVTFKVLVPGASDFEIYGAVKTLDCCGKATSDSYTPQLEGIYYFQAVYSGGCMYLGSKSVDNSEALTVQSLDVCKSPSYITTTLSGGPIITLGNSVSDGADVSTIGRCAPTGSVMFQVSYECGLFETYDTQPLVNGYAHSGDYEPLATGHYEFRAVYSGDMNYYLSTSPAGSEPLEVTPASSSTSTDLGASSITLGQSVTDNATVEGLGGNFPTPTGTVTFWVSTNDGASWTEVGQAVELSGGSARSSEYYMPHATGIYLFKAVYSGDDNYLGSESSICDESLNVNKAASKTTTDLGVQHIDYGIMYIGLGQSVRDNASVKGIAGFPVPTGTVTFYVSSNWGETWNMVGTGPVALDCNGKAMSDWYMPLTEGDYLFKAVYSGNGCYLPSESAICSELLHVDPAPSDPNDFEEVPQ